MDEKDRLFRAFINGEELVPSGKRGAKGTMEKVAIESARECTNAKVHQDKRKNEIVERLEIKIAKNDLLENKILFIRLDDDDDFPAELNGLVAMQLASKYNRPTIVARLNDEGYIRGSARGLNQSELASFKTFLNDTDLFEYTMGHDNAFGISIKNSDLAEFHKIANQELNNIDFGENVYVVDFERYITDNLYDLICDLANYENVWGQQNPESTIAIKNIIIRSNDIQIIGRNSDTLKIEKNGVVFIKFFAKDLIKELKQFEEMELTIIGTPNLNEWMGKVTPQLFIKDMEVKEVNNLTSCY
jgi:single-stranded-DNA-specific exonuclease